MILRGIHLARAPRPAGEVHSTARDIEGDVSSMQVKPIFGSRRGRAAAIGVLAVWRRGR